LLFRFPPCPGPADDHSQLIPLLIGERYRQGRIMRRGQEVMMALFNSAPRQARKTAKRDKLVGKLVKAGLLDPAGQLD